MNALLGENPARVAHATVVPTSRIPGLPALATPQNVSLLASRTGRIVVLILAIALLSVADLHNTLIYLRSVGMSEANPVAREVMRYNSPALLVVWKSCCTALACLIFFIARRRFFAELACWVCCLVLVWLTIRWGIYNAEVQALTPSLHGMTQIDPNIWVSMSP